MPKKDFSSPPAGPALIDISDLGALRSKRNTEVAQAGWKLYSYCKIISITPQFYYSLPEELRPRSVKLRKRRIIIEPPRKYLERLAAAQEGEDAQ
jgi:hypothetical protein